MEETRVRVSLDKLGIANTKVKRAQSVGLLVEIPGEDATSKTDSLAERLGILFKARAGIKIVRPIRKVEFGLLDLDESVTAREIAEAVAHMGRLSQRMFKWVLSDQEGEE